MNQNAALPVTKLKTTHFQLKKSTRNQKKIATVKTVTKMVV